MPTRWKMPTWQKNSPELGLTRALSRCASRYACARTMVSRSHTCTFMYVCIRRRNTSWLHVQTGASGPGGRAISTVNCVVVLRTHMNMGSGARTGQRRSGFGNRSRNHIKHAMRSAHTTAHPHSEPELGHTYDAYLYSHAKVGLESCPGKPCHGYAYASLHMWIRRPIETEQGKVMFTCMRMNSAAESDQPCAGHVHSCKGGVRRPNQINVAVALRTHMRMHVRFPN